MASVVATPEESPILRGSSSGGLPCREGRAAGLLRPRPLCPDPPWTSCAWGADRTGHCTSQVSVARGLRLQGDGRRAAPEPTAGTQGFLVSSGWGCGRGCAGCSLHNPRGQLFSSSKTTHTGRLLTHWVVR